LSLGGFHCSVIAFGVVSVASKGPCGADGLSVHRMYVMLYNIALNRYVLEIRASSSSVVNYLTLTSNLKSLLMLSIQLVKESTAKCYSLNFSCGTDAYSLKQLAKLKNY